MQKEINRNSLDFLISLKKPFAIALTFFLFGIFGIVVSSFADGTYHLPKEKQYVALSDFKKMYDRFMEYAIETRWTEEGPKKDGMIIILKAMESEYNKKTKQFCKESEWDCDYPPYKIDTSKMTLR